jgi:hypothetical protein
MDSLIMAAARALAVGGPLGALNRVALREDALALAFRDIAMAQLGELVRARTLMGSAARLLPQGGRGPRKAASSPRPEIALVSCDLDWSSGCSTPPPDRAPRRRLADACRDRPRVEDRP